MSDSIGREAPDGWHQEGEGDEGSRYDRRAQDHRLEAGRADRTQRSSDDASPGPHGQDGRGWTEREPPAGDRRGECLL